MSGIELENRSNVSVEKGFLFNPIKVGCEFEYSYKDDPEKATYRMTYQEFGLYNGEVVVVGGKVVEYFDNIDINGFCEGKIGFQVGNSEPPRFLYLPCEIKGERAFLVTEPLRTRNFRNHKPIFVKDLAEICTFAKGDLPVNDL